MNPDGTTGIRLHIDAGIERPSRDYSFGGASTFEAAQPCARLSDGANSMAENRFQVFHQAAVVNNHCTAAGVAGTTDFMLNANAGGGFGHVFMHELGHTVGLDHGDVNSYSVMSKVIVTYPGQGQILDYQRYPIDALDESNLSEPAGYQSTPAGEEYLSKLYSWYHCPDNPPGSGSGFSGFGPANANIDWDCDGWPFYVPPESQYIDPDPVSADINGDGVIGIIPAEPAEWPLLNLNSQRIGADG